MVPPSAPIAKGDCSSQVSSLQWRNFHQQNTCDCASYEKSQNRNQESSVVCPDTLFCPLCHWNDLEGKAHEINLLGGGGTSQPSPAPAPGPGCGTMRVKSCSSRRRPSHSSRRRAQGSRREGFLVSGNLHPPSFCPNKVSLQLWLILCQHLSRTWQQHPRSALLQARFQGSLPQYILMRAMSKSL